MECFLLYLDDMDDLVYAFALTAERIRRIARAVSVLAIAAAAQLALILLALRSPELGAGIAAVLVVVALCRSATAPVGRSAQHA